MHSTGLPPSAGRLQLCCFPSGPVEQISTEVKSDGSFEFFNVPVGEFTADLRTSPLVRIVDPAIIVGSQGTKEQHWYRRHNLFPSLSERISMFAACPKVQR
jgi:hypothetical protein